MSKLISLRLRLFTLILLFSIFARICRPGVEAAGKTDKDDDTIVTEAASDEEMSEFHSRTKRQITQMYPSFGQQQQQIPWGQTQHMIQPRVPMTMIQQQPQQQTHFIYPQQQQQQTIMQPSAPIQQQQQWTMPIFQQQHQQSQQVVQQPASNRFPRAHNQNQQPRVQQQATNQRQPSDGSCQTNKGETGICVSLTECYPYITISNQATIDLLMRVSTPCSSDSALNVIFTQNGRQPTQAPKPQFFQKSQTICCAGGPPLKPSSPPTSRPVGYPQHQPVKTEAPARKWDKSSLPLHLQALVPPNSTPVPIQKYPWTVAIMNGERHHCGGSLLSKYTVLTAAHCVHMLDSYAIANLRVLLGHHDISTGARPEAVTRRVIKSIYHSQFSMRTLHNDIALLILDQAAPTESVKISPVVLSTEPVSSGTVTIAGWGQMGWNLPATPMLMETTIEIWNNRKCASVYGALAPGGITANMICGTAVGKDACRGDSGGPLMKKKANGYEQIGIVSWGIECGRYPSVHTRVNAYLPWIQKNRVD